MRISDWSSDVCSSDLALVGADDARPVQRGRARARIVVGIEAGLEGAEKARRDVADLDRPHAPALVVEGIETGRAGLEALAHQGHGPRPAGRVEARVINCLDQRLDPLLLHPSIPSRVPRSEEHTSELQSLMRISYAVFCLQKK